MSDFQTFSSVVNQEEEGAETETEESLPAEEEEEKDDLDAESSKEDNEL